MTSPSSSSPAASPSGRKVRDVAADWHNAVAKWDRLVVESGLALASRVANSRLASPKEGNSAPTAEASAAESARYQELERDCNQLVEVWEKLRGLLQTMEKLTSTLQAVCDLEWYQNKQAWRPTPLFRSWPTTTFQVATGYPIPVPYPIPGYPYPAGYGYPFATLVRLCTSRP
ncbi:cyclin-dependent kinase 2-interacting protein isoform X2 [Lampetra planeri]